MKSKYDIINGRVNKNIKKISMKGEI